MNKIINKMGLMVAIISIAVLATNCSSGQVEEAPSDDSQSTNDSQSTEQTGYSVEQANTFLADLTYAPSYPDVEGMGFKYKETVVPEEDFRSWLSKYKTQIEQALSAVDVGFVLQITGHTDSIGPRHPEGEKKGNIYYSTERAKNVYRALQNLGIPTDKMTYKGIADDEPLPQTEYKDRRNRRVTFKIAPSEAE